jgi:hypothetical protein
MFFAQSISELCCCGLQDMLIVSWQQLLQPGNGFLLMLSS